MSMPRELRYREKRTDEWQSIGKSAGGGVPSFIVTKPGYYSTRAREEVIDEPALEVAGKRVRTVKR